MEAAPQSPPAHPPRRPRPVVPDAALDMRSLFLGVLAFAALLAVLRLGRELLVPLALAVLGSYVLEWPVATLARLRFPRALGAALVLGTLVACTAAGAWAVADDVGDFVQQLPADVQRVRESMRRLRTPQGPVGSVERLANELERTATPPPPPTDGVPRVRVETPPLDVRGLMLRSSVGLGTLLGQGLLLLFLVYFLLASGDLFKRKLIRLAGPSLESRRLTVRVLEEVDTSVQRFLAIMAITSLFVGVASWLAFWLLGLEHAGLWGLVCGVINVVPWIGTVVPVVGAGLIAFLQFDSIGMTAAVVGAAAAVQIAEGGFLTPKLVGRACRMNDVAVFTSLLVWSWLWGLPGLLLAVPIMMVLKAVCDHVEDLRPLGELLGS